MSLDKEYDTLSEMMMTLMNDVGSIPDGSSFGSPPRAWPAADSAPRWLCWAGRREGPAIAGLPSVSACTANSPSTLSLLDEGCYRRRAVAQGHSGRALDERGRDREQGRSCGSAHPDQGFTVIGSGRRHRWASSRRCAVEDDRGARARLGRH